MTETRYEASFLIWWVPHVLCVNWVNLKLSVVPGGGAAEGGAEAERRAEWEGDAHR